MTVQRLAVQFTERLHIPVILLLDKIKQNFSLFTFHLIVVGRKLLLQCIEIFHRIWNEGIFIPGHSVLWASNPASRRQL